ncbi:hypothetical protein LTR17_008695 [Elasticomyces elasticus]|nr:hypothetical protein LTR17_008695 [Elasticomyces elasticus]
MPLGASITVGVDSSDLNGYRKDLRDLLEGNGNNVTYVGTNTGGTMDDGFFEAVSGYTIANMDSTALGDGAYQYLPNVILIHLGTNDCGLPGKDPANAPARYTTLLNHIKAQVPNALVVASSVIHNLDPAIDACIVKLNAGNKISAAQASASGQKVIWVDMYDVVPYADINVKDKTHPNDAGYALMAGVWYKALVNSASLISAPDPNGKPPPVSTAGTSKCQKTTNNAKGPVRIAKGSGTNDGPYVHSSVEIDGIINGPPGTSGGNIRWADIDGDGRDDYVFVNDTYMGVMLNLGGNRFGPYRGYANNLCKIDGIRFADINADNRTDFLCISPNGDLVGFLNKPGFDSRKPVWGSMGVIKPNEGYKQGSVYLGDIDGDGRVDYMVVHSDGQIFGWRNAGVKAKPSFWQYLGQVFDGSGVGDHAGFKFVDINGDGRTDFLHIDDDTGAVHTWINQRGFVDGLRPVWVSAGRTHAGIGHRTNVTFGRVAGSPRADLLWSKPKGGVDLWQETGHGGTRLKGDGVRYCDMLGRKKDDYVWMDKVSSIPLNDADHADVSHQDGVLTLFTNIGDPPEWGHDGVVYHGIGAKRENIHLADLTGDGKCDYLIVDPSDGTVRMLENGGMQSDGMIAFTDRGVVFKGGPTTCIGVGVRFADLNGDGRADYICVTIDGTANAWLNTGPKAGSWTVIKKAKASVGADRANLDKFDGSVKAWTNEGVSGGKITWTSRGVVALGVGSRGETIAFANIQGLGRADYIIRTRVVEEEPVQEDPSHRAMRPAQERALVPLALALPVVAVRGQIVLAALATGVAFVKDRHAQLARELVVPAVLEHHAQRARARIALDAPDPAARLALGPIVMDASGQVARHAPVPTARPMPEVATVSHFARE